MNQFLRRFVRTEWRFKHSAETARSLWADALASYILPSAFADGKIKLDPYLAKPIYSQTILADDPFHRALPSLELAFDPLGLAIQVFREHEKHHKINVVILDEVDENLVPQKVVHFMSANHPTLRYRGGEQLLLPLIVADWLGVDCISPMLKNPVVSRDQQSICASLEQLYRSGHSHAFIGDVVRKQNIILLGDKGPMQPV